MKLVIKDYLFHIISNSMIYFFKIMIVPLSMKYPQ